MVEENSNDCHMFTDLLQQDEMRLQYCVAVGPQFSESHNREAFTWAGVSRNISCFPLAEPPATVEWMRFGQRIINNNTYHIINTKNASYLQVPIISFASFYTVAEI